LIGGNFPGFGSVFNVAALEAGHGVVAGARIPGHFVDLESWLAKNICAIGVSFTNQAQENIL
jgi:hypothetical protein